MSADWDGEQRAALVALLREAPSRDWDALIERIGESFDAVGELRGLDLDGLFAQSRIDAALERAHADVARWNAGPFTMLTFLDEAYPERLRSVRQTPPLIFTQGELSPGEVGVSVVGSRKASQRALNFARDVSRLLVAAGRSVIAGLAEGVDTAAHTAALDAGGRTVAVVGCGLEHVYPASNRHLQARIASMGLVLSQFMPSFSPTKWSFPVRNATMSAYGYATIIVEATEKSGTRIQAREAVSHGRPVVMTEAVARGTNWGAQLQGQPGVYVASSAEQAASVVDQILGIEASAQRLLALA